MNIRFIIPSILFLNLISSVASPINAQQEAILNAIKNNSGDSIKQALMDVVKQGKDVKSPELILLKAIMTGTSDEIKKAVQPLINEGKNNISPVTWAVLLNKPEAVKVLLDCGTAVDVFLAQYVAKSGDLKTALLFAKNSIDISSHMDAYMNLAIGYQDLQPSDVNVAFELIQELIKRGYDVNKIWSVGLMPHENLINLMIKNGANPNFVINETTTPLIRAIESNDERAIKALLAVGANVNPKVDKSRLPLALAIQRGQSSIVALLLEHDATL